VKTANITITNIALRLPSLASFTDLTVAGAITTATHGSGVGNLATAVSAIELVTANGKLQKFTRKQNSFQGVVISVGALGIITRITLDVQPAYTIRQWVYENLTLDAVGRHFEEIMSSGYSVSLFTDWQNGRIRQLWIKARDGEFAAPERYFGATRATKNVNPEGLSAENNTEQMGIPGPWYERLPHFRPGTTARVGEELQSEYCLPREHAVEAILAVEKLRDEIAPLLFISELRVVKRDELWLSTAWGRDSVTIHFTWKKEQAAVTRLLPLIERELAPFRPRPHWGKLFSMAPESFLPTYGKLDDFVRLATKFDPSGKFRNEFLNANVFSSSSVRN
jgi:xylitol oxidase